MTTESKKKIGFIGLGNMGWPMATHIQEAGYELSVFDSNPEVTQDFASKTGAKAAANMKEMAEVDIVVTMLPTGKIVHDVLVNAEDGAFINNARPGTLIIDMSSSEPVGTKELGAKLAAKQIHLVDAPVSGAKPRAILGNLTIMIGGNDADIIEQAKPILQTMGEKLFETGALGTGHAVKALNNFLGATAYAALAEALLIAERFDLDRETLVDIVNVSTGKSFISEVVAKEHILEEKFGTGFALGLLTKDAKIAADLGAAVNLDAPLSRLVHERWQQACEEIGYNADNTEAIKAWNNDL